VNTLKAKDRGAWRVWLKEYHSSEKEVWLLFYKKHARKASVPYEEAVEEALCFGWIDSAIRRVDDDSYAQKFTPRKPGSKWSSSNLTRMRKLIDEKMVSPAGMEVYAMRGLSARETQAQTRGKTRGKTSRKTD
jgi:uncharacterized protein YdeI (YjbR/CyaY-like superfamily)